MESETKSDTYGDDASETNAGCATPIDREAEFRRGLEAYRAFCHFDAQDIWTEVFQVEKNDTTRRFLQALIQVTNAMHKVRHNGELRGALHLLERALIKLDELPDVYGGIDLALFRDGTRSCLAEVARLLSIKSVDLADSFVPQLNVLDPEPTLEPHSVIPPGADPDKLLAAGLEAYRNGRYFDAHELWEESRRHHSDDHEAIRELLKALILVATAMHKLHRAKSPNGAAQLLEVALHKLRDTPDGTLGASVAELIQDVERIHIELEAASSRRPLVIDPSHVPQIRISSS